MATAALNSDPTMLDRLEKDLMSKVTLAYAERADINAKVMGVFSLDDLENKNESDLAESIAVGVGYYGAQGHNPASVGQQNGERGPAGKMIEFNFIILLALPAHDGYVERPDATTLLTILRLFIQGSIIDNDPRQRCWDWIQEKPEIADSTDTTLYYSQLWRVLIPVPTRRAV